MYYKIIWYVRILYIERRGSSSNLAYKIVAVFLLSKSLTARAPIFNSHIASIRETNGSREEEFLLK